MDCCDIIRSLRRLDPTQHHNTKLSILSGTTSGASTSQSTSVDHPSPTSSAKSSSSNLANHLKSGVAGGIAGCLAKTLVSPLDRVKILFQTGNPDYAKYTGSLGGVLGRSGLSGTKLVSEVSFKDILPLWIFPYAGIKFMSYDILHKSLMPETSKETASRRFIAGALSGVMAVFVTYPLEIVRVRTAIQIRKSSSEIVRVRDVARSLYLEKPSIPSTWDIKFFQRFPITKFYRGFAPTTCGQHGTLCRNIISSMGNLTVQTTETFTEWDRRQRGSEIAMWIDSGMAAQTVSYPLEIIRRKMQVGGPLSHRTISQTAQLIFNTQGFRGFFIGLSIGYLKVIPMTAISFVTWSKLKVRFE
ncbi:hypothetical protein H4Q26_016824 [Puccinia striiformis f. sp. tritici PST-130]|nr:hypothetical protein H4Q26_016824 [Puccinia striiformis f. sp. tritici PST-130]